MTKTNWQNYIPQGRKLLLLAIFIYYLVCYVLAGMLGLIERLTWRVFTLIQATPNFSIANIVHYLFSTILFYAVIFALSFAVIRYFLRLDDKPYSYFRKTNLLIIFVIAILLDTLSNTLSTIPVMLARQFFDKNLVLYYIIISAGELIKLALLAAAMIYIWKLTFKIPMRAHTLFMSAYWNVRGLIALTVALILIAFSAFLSCITWQIYDGYSISYSLMSYVNMLSGGMQVFPQFKPFRFYTTLLLFMIPVFYQCKPLTPKTQPQ